MLVGLRGALAVGECGVEFPVIISYIDSHTVLFEDTAATEIYTLSLHDALPIYTHVEIEQVRHRAL